MTPSDADRLVELALRCEEATGPDRELDREIELAVFPDRTDPPVGLSLLEYSASLDAAMTLDCAELRQFGGPLALLREAMDRLFRAKADDSALPRFLVAAFLRARAEVARSMAQ